jgi:hypothetical protein
MTHGVNLNAFIHNYNSNMILAERRAEGPPGPVAVTVPLCAILPEMFSKILTKEDVFDTIILSYQKGWFT